MTVNPFHGTPARAHLLLIEDASVLRELEVLALAGGGFAVTAMEHPGDALRHLQTKRTDAVVVNTDRSTALQPNFIAALRHAKENVPILVLRTTSSAIPVEGLEVHGANLVVDRPLHPTQLLLQVDAWLGSDPAPAAPKAAESTVSAPASPEFRPDCITAG